MAQDFAVQERDELPVDTGAGPVIPRDYFDTIPLREPPVRSLPTPAPAAAPTPTPAPAPAPADSRSQAKESAADPEPPRNVVMLREVPDPESEHDDQTAATVPVSAAVRGVLIAVAGLVIFVAGLMIGRSTAARPGDRTPASFSGLPDEVSRLGSEVDQVQADLASMSKRVDGLDHRLEALPPAPSPPDLAPVTARIDGLGERLGKVSTALSDAAQQISALKTAAGGTERQVAEVRTRFDSVDRTLAALQAQVKELVEPSWSRGVELFRRGQYTAARDVFARLREARPEDARLWYYSALANGFATARWDGETERLVSQGVLRERAGAPPAAEIDAAFAELPVAGGKAWLDSFRRRAGRP